MCLRGGEAQERVWRVEGMEWRGEKVGEAGGVSARSLEDERGYNIGV